MIWGYTGGKLFFSLEEKKENFRKYKNLHQKLMVYTFLKKFIWERERAWVGGGGEEERESQADSPLNAEPDVESISQEQAHDLSQNQESVARSAEPSRCPRNEWSIFESKYSLSCLLCSAWVWRKEYIWSRS